MSARTSRPAARDRTDDASAGSLRPTPALAALVLAAGGGGLAFLAFPPFGLWPLMPVGIAMLTIALIVRGRLFALLLGLVWGTALMLPLTSWAHIYAGPGPWVALAVFEALYTALFALLAREVIARRGITWRSTIVLALLFTGAEILRSTAPWGGLSWGSAAFTLEDSPLLTLGPWIGVTGLGLVVAWLGQLLALGVVALTGRRRGGFALTGVWPLAVATVVVLACIVVPRPVNPSPDDGATMRIAGIQGGTPRIAAQDLDMPTEIYPNSLSRTREAAARARERDEPLDLVVWPEDSTGWDVPADALRSENIRRAAADANAPVLVGGQAPAPGGTRENLAMLWTKDGGPAYSYAKRHPVPFGEYIPARGFFRSLTDKVDLVPVDMVPGSKVGVMDIGGRKVGVLICFEIAYEGLVQDVTANGAEVIVVQTNTALFGDSYEAVQQLAQSRVLASVTGRSIVQVATVGPSAIVTPDGRVISEVGHWKSGEVVADVPLRTGIAPSVAAGPWISVGVAGLAIAGLALALTSPQRALPRRQPRSRRSRGGQPRSRRTR